MTNADFSAADLSGASFRDVRLSGVNMAGATGIETVAFDGACMTSGTILPQGISLENCFSQ
jgi:uncharacterized protein YjbI with pentapeptide repeats